MYTSGGLWVPNTNHQLNQGRVAWWKILPRTSGGGKLIDLMGNCHGAISPGVTWRGTLGAGSVGALKGNGTTGKVTVSPRKQINGLTTLTFSCWLNWDLNTDSGMVEKTNVGTGSQGWGVALATASSCATLTIITSGNNLFVGTDFTNFASKWTHVCFTWTGGLAVASITPYINGVVAAKTTTQAGTGANGNDSANSLTLMNVSVVDSGFYANSMDGASIWNRALSATEVYDLYQLEKTGGQGLLINKSPVQWFPVQSGAASVIDEDGMTFTTVTMW